MAENGHFGKFWGGFWGCRSKNFPLPADPTWGSLGFPLATFGLAAPPPREVLQTLKQKPETQGPTFQNGTGVIYASLCHMFFLVSGLF